MRFLVITEDDWGPLKRVLQSEFGHRIKFVRAGFNNTSLPQDSFDLAVLDCRTVRPDTLEILRLLKARWLHLPVIMVANPGGEEIGLAAFRVGLSDYVPANDLGRLGRAARESIEIIQRSREQAAALERYRAIAELTSDYAYEDRIGPDGHSVVAWATEAFTHITGYTLEEFNDAQGWIGLSYPDDVPLAQARCQRLLAGEPAITELRIITKSDEVCWLRDHARPVKRNGQIIVYGAAQDITRQKQAEESLLKSQMRLASIINISEDAIISIDREQNITLFNQGAERIFGYQAEEVLGRPLDILLPERYHEIHRRHVEMFAASTEVLRSMNRRGFIYGLRKGGHEFPAEASISQYELGAEKIMTVRLRDVAEKRLLEEQLRQSQKMEAIGRLAGGVAHDFNNLLTIINSYADLLMVYFDEDHPACRDIRLIRDAGERAAALTNQLLAFSRKQVLQLTVFNLNDVVKNLNKMLRRLIGEDIAIVTSLDPQLGQIKADLGQIEHVIMNIAVNARDAMPHGGKLTIETANINLDNIYAESHVEVMPGAYVMLAITDNGIGINKETLAHIFEPFFTTKEQGKGTGLGLAMVHGIIKQSGGHIWVYSEPGRGTVFKIYLPRHDPVPEEARTPARLTEMIGGSETVLVVEDEAGVRGLVTQILRDNGYTVLEAGSSAEAEHLNREYPGPIHLLLTDVILPDQSGRQLSAALTSLRPNLKTLYMSGYTGDAIVHHGVLEEGIALLEKPFSPQKLADKVRAVLDGQVT